MVSPKDAPTPVLLPLPEVFPSPARSAEAPAFVDTFWFTFALTFPLPAAVRSAVSFPYPADARYAVSNRLMATAPATPTFDAPAPEMLMTLISLVSPSFRMPARISKLPLVCLPVMMTRFSRFPARIATLTPTPFLLNAADALETTFTELAAFASTVSFPVEVVSAVTFASMVSFQTSTAMAAAAMTLPSAVSADCGVLELVPVILPVPPPVFFPAASALFTNASGVFFEAGSESSEPELSSSFTGAPLALAILTVSDEFPLSAVT